MRQGHMSGYASRTCVAAILLMLAACSHWGHKSEVAPGNKAARTQLSVGYSLLYQEADGIPKLKWLLAFKNKSDDMGRATDDLVSFYQHLAQNLQRLSKEFPAVRIDVTTMPQIEAVLQPHMEESEPTRQKVEPAAKKIENVILRALKAAGLIRPR